MATSELIVVIDRGGAQARNIARQVRDMRVYSKVRSAAGPVQRIIDDAPRGVIVARAGDEADAGRSEDDVLAALHEAAIPVLDLSEADEPANPTAPVADDQLRRFLFDTCGCTGRWTMEAFAEQAVAGIREQVGQGAVICGLSGGVDSAVAAALVQKAVGDQLVCILVDHGLLRKGEAENVTDTFAEQFQVRLVAVDAVERFLHALAGVVDPEEKRKIIGELFIRIFEEEARKQDDARYLVQGTLYTDVIESGEDGGQMVKSHHNVGGLPEDMNLQLVEPLRFLFKDEVRALGRVLGVPDAIVDRHPFPGPGLAIRIVGEVTAERLEIVREADAIVLEEIEMAGMTGDIFQAFAALTDTRTVGVTDGERTYGYMLGVRAVTGADGMDAEWARLPHDVLDRIGNRIMARLPAVNRVVYDISSKPPSTIEWE